MHVNLGKSVHNISHNGTWCPWTITYSVEGSEFEDPSGSSFGDHNLRVEVSQILDSDYFSQVDPDWDKYGYIWSDATYHAASTDRFVGKHIYGASDDKVNYHCRHYRLPCREGNHSRHDFESIYKLSGESEVMTTLKRIWTEIYRDLTR